MVLWAEERGLGLKSGLLMEEIAPGKCQTMISSGLVQAFLGGFCLFTPSWMQPCHVFAFLISFVRSFTCCKTASQTQTPKITQQPETQSSGPNSSLKTFPLVIMTTHPTSIHRKTIETSSCCGSWSGIMQFSHHTDPFAAFLAINGRFTRRVPLPHCTS